MKCAFNNQKHQKAWNNQFQPYLSLTTIRAMMGSKIIYLERFQGHYFKDRIWAAKEVWQEKLKHTKMNNFLVD